MCCLFNAFAVPSGSFCFLNLTLPNLGWKQRNKLVLHDRAYFHEPNLFWWPLFNSLQLGFSLRNWQSSSHIFPLFLTKHSYAVNILHLLWVFKPPSSINMLISFQTPGDCWLVEINSAALTSCSCRAGSWREMFFEHPPTPLTPHTANKLTGGLWGKVQSLSKIYWRCKVSRRSTQTFLRLWWEWRWNDFAKRPDKRGKLLAAELQVTVTLWVTRLTFECHYAY